MNYCNWVTDWLSVIMYFCFSAFLLQQLRGFYSSEWIWGCKRRWDCFDMLLHPSQTKLRYNDPHMGSFSWQYCWSNGEKLVMHKTIIYCSISWAVFYTSGWVYCHYSTCEDRCIMAQLWAVKCTFIKKRGRLSERQGQTKKKKKQQLVSNAIKTNWS